MHDIRRPLNIPEQGRILVRANNWIGDVVISTPALAAIRQAFPSALVSVLAKPWVLPLLRFNPHVDRIICYDAKGRHRGFQGKRRLASDLRGEDFDAAILLQRAFEAAWIAFLARIPRRAGLSSDGRGLLLTHGIRSDRGIFDLHRVEHNLELLARMGIPASSRDLVLPVGAQEEREAYRRLMEIGVRPGSFCFGLNPGAAFGSAKRWNPERFAELSARLIGETQGTGLIFGSASERGLGDEIRSMASGASLVNLAGATKLSEAIALIGLCGLFVSNDSGLMHVAAALDVPLVSIFGPTRWKDTAPWCKRQVLVRKDGVSCSPCMERECREGHHQCMESISVDDVFHASRDLLCRYGLESVEKRSGSIVREEQAVPVVDFGASKDR